MHACVRTSCVVCVCVCGGGPQCFLIFFLHLCLLTSSSLVCRSAFFTLHSSPGDDYEWHDTNVSTSCSAAQRQGKEKVSITTREAVSPLSHLLFPLLIPSSHCLSQQVDRQRSHPVTSQLSTCFIAA